VIHLTRELRDRRKALVSLSTAQRNAVGARLAPARRSLAAADRVTAALRAHPVAAGLAAAAIALAGPRRLLRWIVRVAPVYSLLSRL
jgi:hypothetical protein